MSTTYLKRYAYQERLINSTPDKNLSLIITIPCYNEESLMPCLESLAACEVPPDQDVEVIILVNEPENASISISDTNQRCINEAQHWVKSKTKNRLHFYIFYKKLPNKHAGVGLARKIIMDEAARRFEDIGKSEGIIACYDADCTCDPNYIEEILDFFRKHPRCPGASIYFEHPIDGINSEAIIDYELFLRYYVNALRYSRFPHAFETIGSSMAVRASAYQKQGGMNKRKAGEDFYFLHKIIPLGHFGEINTTRVIPSSRVSDRVPFGTGKAVSVWLENNSLNTYAVETFEDLKLFIHQVPTLYDQAFKDLKPPKSIEAFLESIDAQQEIERIRNNSSSLETFIKQFYHWFDGFKVLKFVHFARDHFYPNEPVHQVAFNLLEKILPNNNPKTTPLTTPQSTHLTAKGLLIHYRKIDRTP